tara:strand:+ start:326 stop:583 length:258 start_codon:yes stop_codon:yes gene_type:complete
VGATGLEPVALAMSRQYSTAELRTQKKTNTPIKLNLKSYFKTKISLWHNLGTISIPEVALISGHKDVRMLFRYTHLKAEDILRKL